MRAFVLASAVIAIAGCGRAIGTAAKTPAADHDGGRHADASIPIDEDGGVPDASNPEPDAGPPLTGFHHTADGTCEWQPRFTGTFTAATYCEAMARAMCDREVRCCEIEPATYESCVREQSSDFCAEDLPTRVRAGLVQVDMAHAQKCLDRIVNLRCESSYYLNFDWCFVQAPLYGQYVNKPAATGSCIADSDCQSNRCLRSADTCGGTCSRPRTIGESCGDSEDCDSRTCTCNYGRCVEFASEFCGPGDCGPGATCTFPARTCRAWVATGAACDPNEDACEPGCRCAGNCVEPNSVAPGGPCLDSGDCAGGWCYGAAPAPGAVVGRCVAYAALGSRCDGEMLRPDRQTGRCVDGIVRRIGDVGDGCLHEEDCLLGLRCGYQCEQPMGIGDECPGIYYCGAYERCDLTTLRCTSKLGAAGTGCANDDDCESHICTANHTCDPPRANGEQCWLGIQCASGWCGRLGCEVPCASGQ